MNILQEKNGVCVLGGGWEMKTSKLALIYAG